MNFKKLENGFQLPELGVGGWPIGGLRGHTENVANERDLETLKHALESNITHFDTAELYADGRSEELLALAIQNYDRSSLIIASKVVGGTKAEGIREACENSLKRLQVDYIDLYYIHWREEGDDLPAQILAMNSLKDDGLIRNIGVSNFNTDSLRKAQELSKHPIVANQVHYNLILREAEADGLIDYCKENDVLLVAYRPLELGKIANNPSKVEDAMEKYKKTAAQVGINWLTSQKNIVTIFGCLQKEYIDENMGALGWTMDEEDVEHLRKNYGGQIFESDCVTLG